MKEHTSLATTLISTCVGSHGRNVNYQKKWELADGFTSDKCLDVCKARGSAPTRVEALAQTKEEEEEDERGYSQNKQS